MPGEQEAWEAAQTLIARFGEDALEEAEIRARELREEGRIEACLFWIEVKNAVRLLLKQQGGSSATS
jgi:hypothetical protein